LAYSTDRDSTITFNGNAILSGAQSPVVSLSIGSNSIQYICYGLDSSIRTVYNIQVIRLPCKKKKRIFFFKYLIFSLLYMK